MRKGLSRYRNTEVTTLTNGTIIVTLHSTDIVTISPTRQVTLCSGGWRTPTTKNRMNEVASEYGLGYGIHQHRGEWFVTQVGLPTLPFIEYMTFQALESTT